jgi:hypothetical protein
VSEGRAHKYRLGQQLLPTHAVCTVTIVRRLAACVRLLVSAASTQQLLKKHVVCTVTIAQRLAACVSGGDAALAVFPGTQLAVITHNAPTPSCTGAVADSLGCTVAVLCCRRVMAAALTNTHPHIYRRNIRP